jgi:hypothetical protein
MSQEDEIEALLREAAKVCHDVSTRAQAAAAEIVGTEPVKRHLTRTAAVNQVGGMAQWRIVCDNLVRRRAELPSELKLCTTDAEQNRGQYLFKSTVPAVVLTVRRQPHAEEDRPETMQTQMREIIESVGVDFGGDVVAVYLVVPLFGGEPRFEVIARGEPITHTLCDLFDAEEPASAPVDEITPPTKSDAVVRSTEDADEDAKREGDADGPRS